MSAPNPYGVYTETNLLGAVMDEDWDTAKALVADLNRSERATFVRQLAEARDLCAFGILPRRAEHP